MINKVILILAISVLVFPGKSVRAQNLYATDSGGLLYRLDARLCSATQLSTSIMLGDIAWYADSLYGIQGPKVYLINKTTGMETQIGSITQGFSFPSLVGDGQGNLYACDIMGLLCKYDIGTGISSSIGNAGVACTGDLAFHNDTLYMIGTGNVLVKMSLNPFTATVVGPLNFGGVAPHPYGLSPSPDNGILYASVGYNGVNQLFKVSTADASVTLFCNSMGIITSNIFGLASELEDYHVGIKEQDILEKLLLYPNPAHDWVEIRFAEPSSGSLHITDILGREQISIPVIQDVQLRVPTAALPTGNYIVRFNGENGIKGAGTLHVNGER